MFEGKQCAWLIDRFSSDTVSNPVTQSCTKELTVPIAIGIRKEFSRASSVSLACPDPSGCLCGEMISESFHFNALRWSTRNLNLNLQSHRTMIRSMILVVDHGISYFAHK